MPKVPKTAPKYLDAFWEYAAQNSRKRAVTDVCLAAPGIVEKHWNSFKEQNDTEMAAKPKKAKKEVDPVKQAEKKAMKLQEELATASPEVQQAFNAILPGIVHVEGSADGARTASADVKASVQTTISNLTAHLDTAKQTLENMQKASPPEDLPMAQPLIQTTTNFLMVVQQGMQDISESLQLEGYIPRVSGQKRQRDTDDEGDQGADDSGKPEAGTEDDDEDEEDDAQGDNNDEVEDDNGAKPAAKVEMF